MPTTTTLAAALLIVAVLLCVMTIAFFRLRRRHRDCRATLVRVATERDQARLELTGGVHPTGLHSRG